MSGEGVKGTKRPGRGDPLTPAQVMAIRASKEKNASLALLFGVCPQTISKIRTGGLYAALPGARKPRRGQFTEEQIREIRAARASGKTRKEVAELFGTNTGMIQVIDDKRAYKWVMD